MGEFFSHGMGPRFPVLRLSFFACPKKETKKVHHENCLEIAFTQSHPPSAISPAALFVDVLAPLSIKERASCRATFSAL